MGINKGGIRMTQKEKEFLEGYQDAMIQFGQRIAHCDRKGIGPNWYYEVAQDMVYDDEPSKQFFCHDKHGNTAYRVIVTERDKGWHKAVDELYDRFVLRIGRKTHYRDKNNKTICVGDVVLVENEKFSFLGCIVMNEKDKIEIHYDETFDPSKHEEFELSVFRRSEREIVSPWNDSKEHRKKVYETL